MSPEISSTSLIEHLSEAGFRSSLITTYSCYFPFYEDVVLRRLVAAGCTHNVIMVDAAQCAKAFANAELRPHRAGRDYTLIPVTVGGAFHPKVFVRFGKSKGSLLVGSHNLTLAGFGLNDEVTNVFRIEGASLRSDGGPLRSAYEYFMKFVPSGLPDVVEAYESLKLGVPWMEGPLGVGDPDRMLLMASGNGPDLWAQIVPIVPGDVSTAFICAPFFDPRLAFVQRLQQDVRPRELVIGIDPRSVEIDPKQISNLTGIRWVNVAGVPSIPQRRDGSYHYLHAKLLWFAGKKGELLVAGSANPSVAAFLPSAGARNVEAVIVDRRKGAATELGISALLGAPPVTAADWTGVSKRMLSKPGIDKEPIRRVWMAIPTAQGFSMHEALPQGIVLKGMGDNGLLLGEATVCDASGLTIDAPEAVRDGARYLERMGPDEHLLVLVHRTEDIAKNIGGDTRKALRQALGALEEDPSQLETLLKLTEKVIFDSDDIVRTTQPPTAGAREQPKEPAIVASTLALDAAGRKSAQRKRSLASGDILVLLDALMRRLGEGLPTSGSPRPQKDETDIGADEEDGGELTKAAPDYEVLAKACRSKMRRLIKRMGGQFKLATAPDRAKRGIVQLAAVLGVVRMLRIVERRPEWRRRQLALVERDDEWRLFDVATVAVTWGPESLAPRAVLENDKESFNELSHVVGLLAWLAWDVGINVEVSSDIRQQKNAKSETWYAIQLLASLGPWLANDQDAQKLFEESIAATPKREIGQHRWIQLHCGLMLEFASVSAAPDHHVHSEYLPRPGDLVVLAKCFLPRVRVVLEVCGMKDDVKLTVFDPTAPSLRRSFASSRVASLPWATAESIAALSA